jgi:hypothetical protein
MRQSQLRKHLKYNFWSEISHFWALMSLKILPCGHDLRTHLTLKHFVRVMYPHVIS